MGKASSSKAPSKGNNQGKRKAITRTPPSSPDSNNSNSNSDTETQTLAQKHGIPFPVFSQDEVHSYKRLMKMKCRIPRTLDWELLDSLKISDDVRKYLKALNLEKYEAMDNVACEELSVEFFTAFVPQDKGKSFTFRIKGEEYKVDNKIMHEVFGFRTTGSRQVPVVHKFLCYNVFGKKDSNKVSEKEVYLLSAMCAKKPICITAFVKETLRETRIFANRPPRLANVVTALAKHFKVQIDEVPLQPKKIALWDLTKAELVSNSTTIIDYKFRCCSKAYMAELKKSSEVGSSSLPPPDTEDEAEDDETQTNPMDYFLPPPVDAGAPDALSQQAPAWFVNFIAHIDWCWEEHNKRLDTFIEHNDRRWEEHNRRIDERWTQWESRQFDQWKQWGDQFKQWDVRLSSGRSLPYPPPQPPPPPPPPTSDATDAQ
ncbi:hypothetical protein STAS_29244 [Striga asiatica]|uniref:Uncharacterized protein n=1 Tax=Striga asiatica TaxID=4170 RepID=A0A5A7R349_STRAF|nr:hypothetical protein STAS_29244 [Striga asiatica]